MCKNNGITLVSLVITIIIMVIISSVAVSLIINGNGLFDKANESAEKYKEAQRNELNTVQELEQYIVEAQSSTLIKEVKIEKEQNTLYEYKIKATIKDEELQYLSKYIWYVNGIQHKTTDSNILDFIVGKDSKSEILVAAVDTKGKMRLSNKVEIIIEQSDIIGKIDLSTSNIISSAFEINVSAVVNGGTIKDYRYFVNGQLYKNSTELKTKVENCDQETEYSFFVQVIDNNNNMKTSDEYKVTTGSLKEYFVDQIIAEGKMGQWVNYEAEPVSDVAIKPTYIGAYSTITFTPSQYTSGWRVLSCEGSGATGTVTLVAEEKVTDMYIHGQNGWGNREKCFTDINNAFINRFGESSRMLVGDSLSSPDIAALKNADTLKKTYNYYTSSVRAPGHDKYIKYVNQSGTISESCLQSGSGAFASCTHGVRPVIKLKPGIKLDSGNGFSKESKFNISL